MKTYAIAKNTIVTNNWQLIPYARLVASYLENQQNGNAHSLRAKRSDLNFWLAYLAKDLGSFMQILLGEVASEHAQCFPEYRLAQGDSAATINRRLATLKAFDKFIAAHVSEYKQIFYNVTGPSVERNTFEGITQKEALALIAAAHKIGNSSFINSRNGFAVAFILATGLRAAEALRVTENQIKGNWITKLKCKGNYFRDVFLPSDFIEAYLKLYMPKRKLVLQNQGYKSTLAFPLLVSEKHKSVSYKTLWRVIAAAAKQAKIRHVSPHKLRHTRAHEILEASKDIRLVAQALGHKSIETTMRYTQRSKSTLEKQLNETRNFRD